MLQLEMGKAPNQQNMTQIVFKETLGKYSTPVTKIKA